MTLSLDADASGLYLAPEDLAELRARAAAARLHWYDLNLARASTKQEFLAVCARGLGFPRTFGANWDALADCLKDLCGECVLSFRNCATFSGGAPADYATALEVLLDAAEFWRSRGSTFVALVDAQDEGAGLTRLRDPTAARGD